MLIFQLLMIGLCSLKSAPIQVSVVSSTHGFRQQRGGSLPCLHLPHRCAQWYIEHHHCCPSCPDYIHSLLRQCSAAITLCLCAVQAGLLVPLLFLTVLFRQAAVGIFDKPQKVLSLRGAADLDKHDKVGLRPSCSSDAVLRGRSAWPGSSTILLPWYLAM